MIDTSCAALLQLAGRVHSCGQKVVLTGEGADEWLVGYPWYKAAKLMGYLDVVPGLRSERRGAPRLSAVNKVPHFPQCLAARSGEFDRRPECLDRFLRPARDLEAALLLRVDARSARDRRIRGPNWISRSNAPNAGIR